MAADQVGRDCVQPGQRVFADLLIGRPRAEGEQEGFRDDVVGRIRARRRTT